MTSKKVVDYATAKVSVSLAVDVGNYMGVSGTELVCVCVHVVCVPVWYVCMYACPQNCLQKCHAHTQSSQANQLLPVLSSSAVYAL